MLGALGVIYNRERRHIDSYCDKYPPELGLTPPPPLDKMVAISQTNETFCIFIKVSLQFVTKGPIDNNPALG